jgi:two-component system, OmpR family, sensor histidine kinase MtrB
MNIRFRHVFSDSLTIRRLVALWVAGILLAWALLVGGWIVAEFKLSTIADQVVMDVHALSEARQLESDIIGHRREYLLWRATGLAYHLDRSTERLHMAEQEVVELKPYVTTPGERELYEQIRNRLRVLREQWPAAMADDTEMEARWVDDLLAIVDEFQQQNAGQMEESIRAADRLRTLVTYGAIGLSVGTVGLLLAGAWSFVRRVLRPTLALTEAASRFGQGDLSVRAAVAHDDELGELARTFNNMAGDIADREKDRLQFVAMVVHDLKNPVLAIEMAARMLHRSNLAEKDRQFCLAGIQEEVASLRRIIRDLTDDIQVVNGRFSIQKTQVDLGALARQFVAAQSKAFSTHEIAVKTDEGCFVQGDPNRIERVLMNLVSNAVKYSPPGTRVMLRVEKEDAQAVLTIHDQGPGIPPEDLKVLFQPFGRGRSAHTLAEGTGMGLYVVKQIVEAHDGRIDVQSKPGQGATFQIRLPIATSSLSDAQRRCASGTNRVQTR